MTNSISLVSLADMSDTCLVELFYKYFDKFTNMIPANVLQLIRLGAILLWLIGATVATWIAWQQGEESAPALGQKLFLSNIKEEIAREQNIHKVGDVVLPDIDDLLRESHKARSLESRKGKPAPQSEGPGFLPADATQIEPQNPVRSASNGQKAGPTYQGEELSPYISSETGSASQKTGPSQPLELHKAPKGPSSLSVDTRASQKTGLVPTQKQGERHNPSPKTELPFYE